MSEADLPLADGTYTLTHFSGRPLPDTVGEVPSRDGRHTGCFLVYTAGELNLDHEYGLFNYWYELRETCQNRQLSRITQSGHFEQKTTKLHFRVDAADGMVFRWEGEVAGAEVAFKREAEPHRFRKFE